MSDGNPYKPLQEPLNQPPPAQQQYAYGSPYPQNPGYPQQPQQGYPLATSGSPYPPQPVYNNSPYPPAQQPTTTSVVVVDRGHRDTSGDDMTSIIIFAVGWLCCPVWCAGWMFACKPTASGTARGFGIASVVMSCLGLVIPFIFIIIFVVILAAGTPKGCKDQSTCDSSRNSISCGYCSSSNNLDLCTYQSDCNGKWGRSVSTYCSEFYPSSTNCNAQSQCKWCTGSSSCIPVSSWC